METLTCDTPSLLKGTWIDAYPGALVPADGPVVEIQAFNPISRIWEPVARDDQNDVEVRALGPRGKAGFRWEVRWTPDSLPAGDYRVVPVARPLEGVDSLPLNSLPRATCRGTKSDSQRPVP